MFSWRSTSQQTIFIPRTNASQPTPNPKNHSSNPTNPRFKQPSPTAPQILHRTIPLQRIAVPTKQLQIIKMVSPALRPRDNVVHRQVLGQEMRPTAVAVPTLRPVKHQPSTRSAATPAHDPCASECRCERSTVSHPSTQARSERVAPRVSLPTATDRSRSTADPTAPPLCKW